MGATAGSEYGGHCCLSRALWRQGSVRQYILVGGAGWQSSNSVRQYTVDGGKVDKVVDVDKEEVSLRCQFAVIDLTPPHM